MALVRMDELMEKAARHRQGVGSFSVGNMEMVKGVIEAAEFSETPVILQIAEVRLKDSPLELMGPMMVEAAKSSDMPIAVHLDHGMTMKTIQKATDYGFTSVMLDASSFSFEENVKKTRQIVELAKGYDACVEAELGIVGGSEDGSEDHEIQCTDPVQARQFVERTGIDALAVAIGNAHGEYKTVPRLQFEVLEEISAKCAIPLVLHGGSGISDDDFRRAISLGIRKVNIATASFNQLTLAAEKYLHEKSTPNYFDLSHAMTEGVYKNVLHHIDVFKTP